MYKSLALGIILAHALVWSLIPYYTLNTVGFDAVEMIAWGRSLDVGYYKHPPMPSWVVVGLESFLPTNLAVFASAQLFIALMAMGVWTLAKSFMSPNSALVATLFTLIMPHTTWISPEWNHNVAQLPFWIWTIVAFHWVCTSRGKNMWAWAFMGIISALGLYAKYSLGILYICIFLYAILWRWYIFNIKNVLIFTITFCAVLAPHAIWLHSVDFLPLTYMQGRFEEAPILKRLGIFWGAFFANLLLVCIGIILARRKFKFRFLSVPLGHFLVYITLFPLLLLTILALTLNISIHSTWNFPFLTMVPIMVLWWLEKWGHTMSALWGSLWVIIINGGVVGYYNHYYTTKLNRGHYPAVEIAQQIQDIWHKQTNTPLAYVAGNQWSAGSIAVYAPDKPKWIINNDVSISTAIDFSDVQQTGYMYIWRTDEIPTVSNFVATGTVTANRHPPYTDIKYTLNWGIVKF